MISIGLKKTKEKLSNSIENYTRVFYKTVDILLRWEKQKCEQTPKKHEFRKEEHEDISSSFHIEKPAEIENVK